jgi:threonine aldolase
MPLHYLQEATTLARSRGLSTHLDGARLFNAAVAGGGDAKASARVIAQCFDSVSLCFSKGLGTPAGSALVGSRDLIARAHRWRKMTGGGMRQAGVLAAAALHALDHHIDRLALDHANAKRLAEGLRHIPGITVTPPDTNIVFAQVAADAGHDARTRTQALVGHLKTCGVLATGLIGLRFVTHLDVDAAGIDHAVDATREFMTRH